MNIRNRLEPSHSEFTFEQIVPAVSHELNTALTTVLGNAHILRRREDVLDASMRADALASLETNAERLFRTVQNLLLFARLELGEEPYVQPILLAHLLEPLVAQERRRSGAREVRLESPSDARPVAADESMLRVAFQNLLDNALLFSPEDSAIDVCASEQSGFIEIWVLDTGPGVAEAEKELIFHPFYRSPAYSEIKPGIGLGLTVARKLAELHRGTLVVSNRAAGGAAFKLSLPVIAVNDA